MSWAAKFGRQISQSRFIRLILGTIALFVIAALLIWLAWPVGRSDFSTRKLRVVAAENFWGDIAQQIGGDNVQVISFIDNPTVDPHLYESNANNAAEIADAQVVIVNGLGYDDFMNKLLAATPSSDRHVVTAASIANASENANPHLWYKLAYVQAMAAAIATAYEQTDKSHTETYQHNLQIFSDSLNGLYNTEQKIRTHYGGMSVAYTERVPGYMLDDVGLSVKTPSGFAEAIENGNDPSPGDVDAMRSLINTGSIKALLYNAQATSAVTDAIRSQALAADIPVVGVTETLPKGMSYQQWQQSQLDKLISALETK